MRHFQIRENGDYVILADSAQIELHCKDVWVTGGHASFDLRLAETTEVLKDLDFKLAEAKSIAIGGKAYVMSVDDFANVIRGDDVAYVSFQEAKGLK